MGAIAATRAQVVFEYDSDISGNINLFSAPLAVPIRGDLYDYDIEVFGAIASTTRRINLQLDFDAGASSYRYYFMKGQNSTASANVQDNTSTMIGLKAQGTFRPLFARSRISGKSGGERHIGVLSAATDTPGNTDIQATTHYWKNTADEATTLNIVSTHDTSEPLHFVLFATPKDSAQEEWELIDTKEFVASAATQTFTGLNGDVDGQYKIAWDGDQSLDIRLNSDAGVNYVVQALRNSNGAIQGANALGTRILVAANNAQIIINATAGKKRLITTSGSKIVSTQQEERGHWWSNTADNLESIGVMPVVATTATAQLFRKRTLEHTSDTLPWQNVEEVAVSGDFSSGHSFDNLTGDREFLYKIEWFGDAGNPNFDGTINNDVSASNTQRQTLQGSGSSVSAAGAAAAMLDDLSSNTGGQAASFSLLIHPKAGQQRPMLHEQSGGEDFIRLSSYWYTNTADEVESIQIFATSGTSTAGTLRLSKIPRIQP